MACINLLNSCKPHSLTRYQAGYLYHPHELTTCCPESMAWHFSSVDPFSAPTLKERINEMFPRDHLASLSMDLVILPSRARQRDPT
jgi:hypothetical protein